LIAATIAVGGHKAGVGWVLVFEVLNSIGYANYFPVGLALYARVSPRPIAGTMIGVYYLFLFLSNNVVGWLGGLMESMPGTQFWLLHAALVAGATVLMLVATRLFGRLLAPNGAVDK
jgi:proton-dependent oligopeptide transporter, POT family